MLYTLEHACSDVMSRGSENYVNQMARLTDLELDVKVIFDPRHVFHCYFSVITGSSLLLANISIF